MKIAFCPTTALAVVHLRERTARYFRALAFFNAQTPVCIVGNTTNVRNWRVGTQNALASRMCHAGLDNTFISHFFCRKKSKVARVKVNPLLLPISCKPSGLSVLKETKKNLLPKFTSEGDLSIGAENISHASRGATAKSGERTFVAVRR